MGLFDSLFGKKKEKAEKDVNAAKAAPAEKKEEEESGDKLDDMIRMLASMQSVQMQTVCKQLVASEAADQLLELYRKQPGGFVSGEAAAEPVRDIGERINKAGGMEVMLLAHKAFADKCGEIGPGLARNLEMVWDHIGSWQG